MVLSSLFCGTADEELLKSLYRDYIASGKKFVFTDEAGMDCIWC